MLDILGQQVLGTVQNSIFNSVFQYTKGVQSPELRAAISRIAEELTVFSMNTSQTTIKDSLYTYQRDLKGIYNPFDTVSSTSQRSSINNNLVGIYGTQISYQIENKAVMLVRDHLRSIFPHSDFINFDVLTDTIIQSFSPSIRTIVDSSVSQVTSNYFTRSSVDSIGNAVLNLSSIFGAVQNLGQINSPWELLFIGETVSAAITDASKFITGSLGDNNKLQVLNRGFIDPTATYPLPEYVQRSEVNKLAQGDISNTIVIEKDKNRMVGAFLPGGASWEQPISSFKGEYPYNKVQQTESGHIIEIDDTPGSERLHIYHKSGTFVEIDPNGSTIIRSVGSHYQIIDRNGKISIAGEADVSVNGACNIFVGNDANIEVNGDLNATCHNDVTVQAGGTLNLTATEEINITSKEININALEKMNILSDAEMSISSVAKFDVLSENEFNLTSKEGMNLQSGKGLSIDSKEDLRLYSEKNVVAHPDGGILLDPGSVVQVTSVIGQGSGGSMIKFKLDTSVSGVSGATKDRAKTAIKALKSHLGLLPGRKDIIPVDVKDPTPLTHVDNYTLLVDEEGQDFDAHRQYLISNGITSAAIFDRNPISSESETDIPYSGRTALPPQDLLKVTELPGNFRLTPSFTVDMLSEKTGVTKDKIVAGDLTYGEIIYNLQTLSLNVLEPAYALFPNLLITSCYRDPSKSTNVSMHTKGQAVDIQFRGSSYDDYYEIALKLTRAISYDQFILEYTSYSKNPWIHISFTKDINRKSIMTFWNNKKYSNGIHRLE
jgi:hypothetical protein